MEYRFQDSYPSTFEFHAGREGVDHTRQHQHYKRFQVALRFAQKAANRGGRSLVDLGCGGGGFLRMARDLGIPSWGYDFTPSMVPYWDGVTAELKDVFNPLDVPRWGEITVVTEVLEHLADPHGIVEGIAHNSKWIVASSPWGETPDSFDECHVWGWDIHGYVNLIGKHFDIIYHDKADWSQVILGRTKYDD